MKSTKLYYVGFMVALLGMFLTQCGDSDSDEVLDPCNPDLCEIISDAVAGSCEDVGGGDFTCDCDAGFTWDGSTHACDDGAVDPCDPDPCQGISDAVAGSCEDVGGDDFTCGCDAGFTWDGGSNACEEEAVDPCNPDPCQGISDAVAGSCEDVGGGDFRCDCDAGFTWNDGSDTCNEEGVPGFAGGVYEMSVSSLTQSPRNCLMNQIALNLITPLIRGIALPLDLPAGQAIIDSGNEFPVTIDLPPPLDPVDVLLSLDGDSILMDGPEVYTADTAGLLPGADCVITGSADGIFDDINTEPLTGSLTIGITDVQASPGGTCTLLRNPAGDCDLTVNLNAGVPLL